MSCSGFLVHQSLLPDRERECFTENELSVRLEQLSIYPAPRKDHHASDELGRGRDLANAQSGHL